MARVRVITDKPPKLIVGTVAGMVLQEEATSSSGSALRPTIQIAKRPGRKPVLLGEGESQTAV